MLLLPMECDGHLCHCPQNHVKSDSEVQSRGRRTGTDGLQSPCEKCLQTWVHGELTGTNRMRGCLKILVASLGCLHKHRVPRSRKVAASGLCYQSWNIRYGIRGPGEISVLGQMWQAGLCAEEDDQGSLGSRAHIDRNGCRSWGAEDWKERGPHNDSSKAATHKRGST